MLDQARNIYVTSSTHVASPVLGALPDQAQRAALSDMFGPKPIARKAFDGLAISVPIAQDQWCIWIFGAVPKATQLPDLIQKTQMVSLGFAALGSPAGGGEQALPLAALSRRVRPIRARRRRGSVAAMLCDQMVEQGDARVAFLFEWRKQKIGRIWGSDAQIQLDRSALSHVVTDLVRDKPGTIAVSDSDDAPDHLDLFLLGKRHDAENVVLALPAKADGGYGVLLLDPAKKSTALSRAETYAALMQLAVPLALPEKKRFRMARWAGWAAAAALVAFLAWPTPMRYTVSGTAIPTQTRVAALPSNGTLEDIFVRVGDQVEEGQIVARFHSTALAEARAQEELNISVEDLNAKRAMAENDYGAFQLAEARREIAQTRLQQAEERIARLTVVAPTSGRVIRALPDTVRGGEFGVGADVVEIQVGSGFNMQLAPSRVDARQLVRDVEGAAYFKGLRQSDFRLRLLTPVALETDPTGQHDRLVAMAEITQGDTTQLIAGLNGYARLEGPVRPRIVGLGRYAAEYIRVKAWTYLGLHL